MSYPRRNILIRLLLACIMALALESRQGEAQTAAMGVANNFSMSEYYESPHETQMKSLIKGKQALPQAGGKYLIKGLRLETYRPDGQREAVVEAPECIYDGVKRAANSPGRLRVVSGQGEYIIEGEGFLWRQDDSKLIISNRVHTIVANVTTPTQKR